MKKTGALVKSAAGFGPETPLARLSPAISLILSGVPQNEVSFGKKNKSPPQARKNLKKKQTSPPRAPNKKTKPAAGA